MKKSIFLIKTFKTKEIKSIYKNINFKKDFFSFRSKKKRFITLYYKFCNLVYREKKINDIFVKGYKNYIIVKGLNICYFGYESSFFYADKNVPLLSKVILLKSIRRITFDKRSKLITFIFKIRNNKKSIKKSIIEIYSFFFKTVLKKKKEKININMVFKKRYLNNFNVVKKLINLGEIMQIQLGCKFFLKKKIYNLNNFYIKLLEYNFKELSFIFSFKKRVLIINSPETFLKYLDNTLEMFPIAGTIRRGSNIFSDKVLEKKIIVDKKENSEHNMLIDMTRNDLTSVKNHFNNEYIGKKKIEKFFFLQHIVSKIKTKNKYEFFNLIYNTFPAGTLTGAPKIKAMKIIKRIEGFKREFYGGIIGFYSKNIYNMTIIIRSVLLSNYCIFFQAASGIVKDSILSYEKKEIENKVKNIVNIFNFI